MHKSVLLLLFVVWLDVAMTIYADLKDDEVLIQFEEIDDQAHSRIKRGFDSKLSEWKDKLRTKRIRDKAIENHDDGSGEDAANVEDVDEDVRPGDLKATITLPDGTEEKKTLRRVKELLPNIESYVAFNGKMVTRPEPEKPKIFCFYTDKNGTDTTLLFDCSAGIGVGGGVFGRNSKQYELDPSYNPYANTSKAKLLVKKVMNDAGRTIGLGSAGEPLGIPFTVKKKRDLFMNRNMQRTLFNRRRKRAAISDNVVELVIVADYSMFTYWYNKVGADSLEDAYDVMNLYFILLTNMMDLRFMTLYESTNKYDMHFMINAIIFMEDPVSSNFTEANKEMYDGKEVADVNVALDDFTKWAWNNRGTFPPHDHIMAVTRLNLADRNDDGTWNTEKLSAAWEGSMCSPGFSTSIIEDPGVGLIDLVAAHEIGHSLGLHHDSSYDGCSDNDFFVMAGYAGSPKDGGLSSLGIGGHPYQLSQCSVDNIAAFIDSLGPGNCMLSNNYDTSAYQAYKSFVAPGVFLPLGTQCEINYGQGSKRCYQLDSTICSDGAWCWHPDDPNYCYTLYVREGTLCGDNQRCHAGTCQNSSLVVPTCPPPLAQMVDGPQALESGDVAIDGAGGANVIDVVMTTVSTGTDIYVQYELGLLAADPDDLVC